MKNKKLRNVLIIAVFVILIAAVFILIPIEQKRIELEEYRELSVLAENDEHARYIIDNPEEYPRDLYEKYLDNSEYLKRNLDYIYDYPFHKDDYYSFTYTDQELSMEEIPNLYMFDKRWCYQTVGETNYYIRNEGCGYVSLTMCYLYLTGKSDVNPKILADISYQNDWLGFMGGGVLSKKFEELSNEIGLSAVSHYYLETENPETLTLPDLEKMLDGETAILTSMSGKTFGNHAIVITGCDGENIFINDPASEEKSDKVWNFNEIKDEIIQITELSYQK